MEKEERLVKPEVTKYEIDVLKDALIDRNEGIYYLRKELKEKQDKTDIMEDVVRSKDEEIDFLKDALKDREDGIYILREERSNLKDEINDLQNEVTELRGEIRCFKEE